MRICKGCYKEFQPVNGDCRRCGTDEGSVVFAVNELIFYGRIKTILLNYGLSETSSNKAIKEIEPLVEAHIQERIDFLEMD